MEARVAMIDETDLMLVCVAAAKALTLEYNLELNDAMMRITFAMVTAKGEDVIVRRPTETPISRDVVERCIKDTVQMALKLEGM